MSSKFYDLFTIPLMCGYEIRISRVAGRPRTEKAASRVAHQAAEGCSFHDAEGRAVSPIEVMLPQMHITKAMVMAYTLLNWPTSRLKGVEELGAEAIQKIAADTLAREGEYKINCLPSRLA